MQWLALFLVMGFGVLLLFFAISNLVSMISGAPAVRSDKPVLEEVLKLANLKSNEKFYELGSGYGFISRFMADHGAKSTGIEISPFYFWYSRFLYRQRQDIEIKRGNIYKQNLNKADIVYCYLLTEAMKKLEPKFTTELKPGTRVISQSFKLPNKKPIKTVKIPNHPNTLYLYQY